MSERTQNDAPKGRPPVAEGVPGEPGPDGLHHQGNAGRRRRKKTSGSECGSRTRRAWPTRPAGGHRGFTAGRSHPRVTRAGEGGGFDRSLVYAEEDVPSSDPRGPAPRLQGSGKKVRSRQQALAALLKQVRKARKSRAPRSVYHGNSRLFAAQLRQVEEEERQRREARRRQGW
jgi:hypothetical protein